MNRFSVGLVLVFSLLLFLQSYAEPNPRYVLSMTAADASGKLWFSLFNDEAVKLLGRTAADAKLLESADKKAFDRVRLCFFLKNYRLFYLILSLIWFDLIVFFSSLARALSLSFTLTLTIIDL